jgi:hypothetical protein
MTVPVSVDYFTGGDVAETSHFPNPDPEDPEDPEGPTPVPDS